MRVCILIAVLIFAGCRGDREPAPAPIAVRPVEAAGLHNVFRVSDRLYSGSSPDGEAGFASLQKLGIRTVISVDGAIPDAVAAEKHGLRYVHLPFGYDGIPRERAAELAKAVADLPGPVYLHCHHGKHRGPAAVAAIRLCEGAWDAAWATAWMKIAGTDPRYLGLYAVADHPPTAEEVAVASGDWKAAAPVPALASRMVEIDARWDALKAVKAAGWKVPPTQPDIDPPHEALQLREHYREAARLDSVKRRGRVFGALLAEAEVSAGELERGLRAGDATGSEAAFARSANACVRCHERFRDGPGE